MLSEIEKHARPLRIFGVPMDLGQKRRGVDMGPSAIRYAGLLERLRRLGLEVADSGNIQVPIREQIEPQPDEANAKNAHAVAEVCEAVYQAAKQTIAAGEVGIFLGGDHSISLGTVAAAIERPGRVGVLWVDAHADFNTPQTTPSGNVHGMVVASLMGMGLPSLALGERRLEASQVAMIGIRDLDVEERVALAQSGIHVMTMRSIDERGMANVVSSIFDRMGAIDSLHVSLDMDSLDPQFARGVGTPVPGGLTYREAHLLMELLADDGRVTSMDIVEVNPILDSRNHTANTAVELAASLFGKRIL